MTHSMGADMDQVDQLNELRDAFEKFVTQYETDMRGDKTINGNKGIVNTLRELRKRQDDFPSLPWLFAHHPVKTWSVVLGIFLFFELLYHYGGPALRGFAALLGVTIPLK